MGLRKLLKNFLRILSLSFVFCVFFSSTLHIWKRRRSYEQNGAYTVCWFCCCSVCFKHSFSSFVSPQSGFPLAVLNAAGTEFHVFAIMWLPGGIWGFDAAATLCFGHHSKLLPTELQMPANNWLWWENKMGPMASWVVVYIGSTARLMSLFLCQLRLCWNNNMTFAWSSERLWFKEINQQISKSEASCGVTAQQTTQWGFFCLLFHVT